MKLRGQQVASVGIFFLALLIRGVFLFQSLDNPTFFTPVVDAATYHQMAVELAEKSFLSEGFFWQPFFYPFFLALIYSAVGISILGAKIVQVLIGSFSCVLVYRLGQRYFNDKIGLLAGIILALYGPAIFFDAELVGASLGAFLGICLLYLFLIAQQTRQIRVFFISGLVGGLAVLTRPTFFPFLMGGLVFLVFFRLERIHQKVNCFLLAVLGFMLVVMPVSYLNYRLRTGEWSFLPFSGGINLYLGNNPDICRTLTIRPGSEWENLISLPRRAGYRHPRSINSFFQKKFVEYLIHQPGSFLLGLGKKTLRFFSSREIPRNVSIYVARKWSSLLSLLVWKVGNFGFPFGLLVAFVALGGWFYWKEIPLLIWGFVLLHSAALILVFISSRYRMEIIPILALLAALGISGLREKIKFMDWRKRIVSVLIFVLALGCSTIPGPFCEEKLDYEAELYYFVGLQQLKKGNLALAENYLGHSLKLNPHRLDCQIALADVHFRRGDSVRAFQEYQRLLELNPQNVKVLRKLGLAFFLGGNSAEAEKMLRLVLKYDPYQDDVYVLLAEIELRQGKLKKAEDLLKKSLTLEVRGKVKAQALLRLTQIAWHQRDFRAVENYLQAGLTADLENYYLLLSLAWLRVSSPLTDQRNVQEAQRLWQKAIRLKGVSHETNLVLAGIYSELGELDKAREVLRHLSGIDEEFPISTREKDKENLGEVLIKEGKIISIKPPFWLKMTY
ncbi:MAG: glycosyltransferase family 39 protein [Candidatus Aminicenantes bacterium]|nr:glycosyltransferase family 39 protein [Candidatus Aminicenantes bacterium]